MSFKKDYAIDGDFYDKRHADAMVFISNTWTEARVMGVCADKLVPFECVHV